MSNYTKTTSFTPKDSLSPGNPSKVIKGSEFDTEFDNIATAIATKANSTSPTLVTPVLGTPSSGTLTNCTGLPISTGVSGLGTGVATFLATPSSANLRTALTDETGTGAAVFATSPTLVTPVLGTPSSGTLTSCTGLPLTTGVTGTLPVANGGTGITSLGTGVAAFMGTPSSANLAAAVTDETGSGALVFATSPTLVTPVLGTPSSGTLTSCTGLPLSTGVTGTLPVANGGTGQTSYTNGQLLIGNTSGNTLTKATLTAGTGISITNSTGSITIANTGATGLVYLSTVSASASSTVDVETGFSSTYDEYVLIGSNITVSASDTFNMRWKMGGAYITSSTYIYQSGSSTSTSVAVGSIGSIAAFRLELYAVNSSAAKVATLQAALVNTTPSLTSPVWGAYNSDTGAISGVRFFCAGGATITGTFKLYGIAKS